jgi:hypothetical protein
VESLAYKLGDWQRVLASLLVDIALIESFPICCKGGCHYFPWKIKPKKIPWGIMNVFEDFVLLRFLVVSCEEKMFPSRLY